MSLSHLKVRCGYTLGEKQIMKRDFTICNENLFKSVSGLEILQGIGEVSKIFGKETSFPNMESAILIKGISGDVAQKIIDAFKNNTQEELSQ